MNQINEIDQEARSPVPARLTKDTIRDMLLSVFEDDDHTWDKFSLEEHEAINALADEFEGGLRRIRRVTSSLARAAIEAIHIAVYLVNVDKLELSDDKKQTVREHLKGLFEDCPTDC